MDKKINTSRSHWLWLEHLEYRWDMEGFSDFEALAEMLVWHSAAFYSEDPLSLKPSCSEIYFWNKVLRISKIRHANNVGYAIYQGWGKLTGDDVQTLISRLWSTGKTRYRIGSTKHALSFEMTVQDKNSPPVVIDAVAKNTGDILSS